ADTMRRSGDYLAALQRFGEGKTQVLLGTQMIAKGLDFPRVKLVGVISADTALHLPDFRAAERTFQLIAQVAGRAGRAEDGQFPSRVIVQTFTPEDHTIQSASQHDYQGFVERELAMRSRDGLPPIGRMARIVCRDPDNLKAKAHATELRAQLDEANALINALPQGSPAVRLRGPMPCPVSRVADFFRWQILMFAGDALSLQKVLGLLRQAGLLKSDARTAVDVDPVQLL
ncbi:MAG: primosomal protein N', partial [Phycisphaerales bacterium]|nr:primosomal protein N' [Phycisphaerales bacterium]